MPNSETFAIPPIGEFVRSYLSRSTVSVDPFARNQRLATWTNDMDLATSAEFHMDAESFARMLQERGVVADLVIFDPPYSPRQIVDCYRSVGLPVTRETSQSARLYKRVRDAVHDLLAPGGPRLVVWVAFKRHGLGARL